MADEKPWSAPGHAERGTVCTPRREQTIGQCSNGLKFLRRTARFASMLVLLALTVTILSAQSQPPTAGPAKTNPSTDWLIVFTAISAGSTAIYALFAGFQWWTMRRQADHMSGALDRADRATDAANRNATAAMASAEAATKSAEVARNALHATQRAFISFENWAIDDFATPRPRIRMDAVNIGHTPAFIVESVFRSAVGTVDDAPEQPIYDDTPTPEPMTIPPQGRVCRRPQLPAGSDFERAEIERLHNGESLFLWGYLKYRDAFKIEHTARFGMYDNGTTKVFSYLTRPGYNDSD